MDLGLVLQVLSWTAMVTTITLFFTGIPICINIYKMGTTGDISGVPFLMGFLGGSFWLRYGLLKSDNTMVTVNVVASSLFFVYCVFYLCYADYKKDFGAKFVAVIATIVGMLFYVQYTPNLDVLGFLCMTFNIINFGAPLAGLGVVLKKKNTESLPLPMCFCNLLVSSQWFLYGNLVNDRYIMIPNGIGMLLAVIQLSLFIIFPRRPNGRSLFQKLCGKKNDEYANEKEPMNTENEHNTPVVDHSTASTMSDSPSTIQQSSDEHQFEKTPLEDTDDQVQIIGHTATSHPNAGNTKIPIV